MRNLQIIGNVPQVRKENNFGEYAESRHISIHSWIEQ